MFSFQAFTCGSFSYCQFFTFSSNVFHFVKVFLFASSVRFLRASSSSFLFWIFFKILEKIFPIAISTLSFLSSFQMWRRKFVCTSRFMFLYSLFSYYFFAFFIKISPNKWDYEVGGTFNELKKEYLGKIDKYLENLLFMSFKKLLHQIEKVHFSSQI